MRKSLVIIVGPSGVGKSTLLDRIKQEVDFLEDTTTFTTRAMRAGESEGHPYHFVTQQRFEELIQKNYFVEYATVHGHSYGTPREQIDAAWSRNHLVIMDVDIQGARTFKAKYPDSLTIFLHPPSFDDLRQRLIKRQQGIPKDLEVRLETARKEIAQASFCEHQLVNDELEKTYRQFKKLIEDFAGKS